MPAGAGEELHVGFGSEIAVGLDEGHPVIRHIFLGEDCVDRAFRLASAAIDAFIGMNENWQA